MMPRSDQQHSLVIRPVTKLLGRRVFALVAALFFANQSLFAQEPAAGTAPDPFSATEVFIPANKRSDNDPQQTTYVDTVQDKQREISVVFQDTPLPQIIRYLTEQTGRKFAAHNSLNSIMVTIEQREQKWTKILETLVFRYDLQVESLGGIIKLSKIVVEKPKNELAELFLLLFKIFLACFVATATLLVLRMFLAGNGSGRTAGARW